MCKTDNRLIPLYINDTIDRHWLPEKKTCHRKITLLIKKLKFASGYLGQFVHCKLSIPMQELVVCLFFFHVTLSKFLSKVNSNNVLHIKPEAIGF